MNSNLISLLNQCVKYIQNQNLDAAESLLTKIIHAHPKNIDALNILGVLHKDKRQYSQSLIFFNKALKLATQNSNLWYNIGLVYSETDEFHKAIFYYTKAIELDKFNCNAWINKGHALVKIYNYKEALYAYDQVVVIAPHDDEAWRFRGIALHELKRFDEALNSYDKALCIAPGKPDIYFNQGFSLQELKLFDDALNCYDKAISIKPNYAEAYSNRGIVLQELKRLDEALNSYDKAISINPNFAEAFSNRGVVLLELNHFDEALTNFDKAINLKQDYAEAYSHRGNALKQLKRFDDAFTSYNKAIHIKPNYAEAHWNLSLLNLLLGNFKIGWEGYDWRWKHDSVSKTSGIRNFNKPLWVGTESLINKTILLYAEQGLGDTIQFCRYVPLVSQLGTKVILEVQRPLVNLLSSLEGVNQIVSTGDNLPEFDYQIPLLSLPRVFKTELASIPPHVNNLTNHGEKISKWQEILGEKRKPRIGLVWSSASHFKEDSKRSMSLLDLLSALPREKFEYICLQKEIKEIDKSTHEANPQIQFFGNDLDDFTDTAALIECVDLVISTCTSVPHLSCSLGKETWLLLSYLPDWRWLLDRDDSTWYPSAKLYRQERVGDWSRVLEKVNADLLLFDKSK